MVLAGCGGGSTGGSLPVVVAQSDGSGCPPIEGTGNAGGLQGIYDVTDYTRSPANVVYTVIGPDGGSTDFDYDGDNHGSGGNCFIKRHEGFASFTLLQSNRYLWTFANPDSTGCPYARDDVFIDRSGSTVTISNTSGSASINWRAVDVTANDLIQCN